MEPQWALVDLCGTLTGHGRVLAHPRRIFPRHSPQLTMELTCYNCHSTRVQPDRDSEFRFHCQNCGVVIELRRSDARDPLGGPARSSMKSTDEVNGPGEPRVTSNEPEAKGGRGGGVDGTASKGQTGSSSDHLDDPFVLDDARRDDTHLSLFVGIAGMVASLLCGCAAPVLMAINLAAFFWAWRSVGPVRGAAMWVNAGAIGLETFLIWWSYF